MSGLIHFAREGVQPPSPLYIGEEDTLVLTAFNSVAGATVDLRYRLLTPQGEVIPNSETLAPTSDRAATVKVAGTTEGFLLDATLVTSSAVLRGQLFCRLTLERGAGATRVVLATLISDYVARNVFLAWPGGVVRSPVEGPGAVRSITGTNPAVGVEINESVPTGARWHLQALRATLLCSAAVASRFPSFSIDDGVNIFYVSPQLVAITAGQQVDVSLGHGSLIPSAGILVQLLTMPVGLTLVAGSRIRSSTVGFQAGDDWSAPQMLVEEWIEP